MRPNFSLLIALVGLSATASASISLPTLFTDHMVLQRETEVRIWGWGKPREVVKITTTWSSDTLTAEADKYAEWEILLPTPTAGGPHEITLQGYNRIVLKDVLIGEVWLCSGQSNMEWKPSWGIDGREVAVKNADHPNIRFFTVDYRSAHTPQIDLSGGGWEACTPETMDRFSAVGYFFGKKLHEELGVPIGLVNSSWGGTPAEAWVAAEVIAGDELLSEAAKLLADEPWGPQKPGRIYHAMIAPLTKFNIAGTIWYQGETNNHNPLTYKELFSILIKSWRLEWDHDFPFYFAQIAPWNGYGAHRGAQVRDAQRRTLEVPGTGMVVTSDIGDTVDIHPRNKLDVGLRFANLALKNHYQVLDAEVAGPLYREHRVEGSRVRVFFDHAAGLHARGGNCTHFEVAGEDGIFHPAQAEIEDGSVVVFSKKVKTPKAVRFAWGNSATPNLFNAAGLPTSCFLTE